MRSIDLNVDVAEGFLFDQELLGLATSANICCGEHAGSWELTCETVELCRTLGVRLGCHPGYPDRASMGRNPISDLPPEWGDNLFEQVRRFVDLRGCEYVKPHGAWYNHIVGGHPEAVSILERIEEAFQLPVMILPVVHRPRQIREGFGDRGYAPDGTLLPRSSKGALLQHPTEIAQQALQLADHVDSICVHGDGPNPVTSLRAIREASQRASIEVSAW